MWKRRFFLALRLVEAFLASSFVLLAEDELAAVSFDELEAVSLSWAGASAGTLLGFTAAASEWGAGWFSVTAPSPCTVSATTAPVPFLASISDFTTELISRASSGASVSFGSARLGVPTRVAALRSGRLPMLVTKRS